MCTPAALLMFSQERYKGQTTAALAGSLDPFIGKIICAAPARTSYIDAMSDNEGSNNHDAESALMGEGKDLDCDEAFSSLNLLKLHTIWIWECSLMNLASI